MFDIQVLTSHQAYVLTIYHNKGYVMLYVQGPFFGPMFRMIVDGITFTIVESSIIYPSPKVHKCHSLVFSCSTV